MNNQALEQHLDWFETVLELRINQYFDSGAAIPFAPPPPPELRPLHPLDQTFQELELNWEEKVIVLLAIIPHVRPQALDIFFTNNTNLNRSYTEFGGVKGKNHAGFLPTKETAVFILAGKDLHKRIEVMQILHPDHPLFRLQILDASSLEPGEPLLSSALSVSKLFLPKVLWNQNYIPAFGSEFPAKKVNTLLNWEDLVLAPHVMEQVMEIKSWVEHEALIQESWGMKKLIKPGYRSLFFGPPGTGKTLTASLLGKALGKDVYRIDLSMIVSKYIGETEKNLSKVFDLAEQSNWILFFDEADALFGKRTLTQSSNDRYANQEVSYLLQRIEDFPGLTVLASNFKGNLDDAFIRRFQSIIHFPAPDSEERLALWQKAFSHGLEPKGDVDLESLADKYNLTGGEIINVLRYAAIQAAKRAEHFISLKDLVNGIRLEFHKNGKTLGL